MEPGSSHQSFWPQRFGFHQKRCSVPGKTMRFEAKGEASDAQQVRSQPEEDDDQESRHRRWNRVVFFQVGARLQTGGSKEERIDRWLSGHRLLWWKFGVISVPIGSWSAAATKTNKPIPGGLWSQCQGRATGVVASIELSGTRERQKIAKDLSFAFSRQAVKTQSNMHIYIIQHKIRLDKQGLHSSLLVDLTIRNIVFRWVVILLELWCFCTGFVGRSAVECICHAHQLRLFLGPSELFYSIPDDLKPRPYKMAAETPHTSLHIAAELAPAWFLVALNLASMLVFASIDLNLDPVFDANKDASTDVTVGSWVIKHINAGKQRWIASCTYEDRVSIYFFSEASTLEWA